MSPSAHKALHLPDPGDHSPDAVVRCHEALAVLQVAITELSDRRADLAHRLYDGHPTALAQVLGVHPATAEHLLARATGQRVNHDQNARRAATAKRLRAGDAATQGPTQTEEVLSDAA